MIYYFIADLIHHFSIFNVCRYITFRTICAVFTALLVSFIFGKKFISFLKSVQTVGQPIREDGPDSHIITKAGTPTMGGALILFSTIVSTIIWVDLQNKYVWICLSAILAYGVIGFIDDYRKLKYKNSKGLSAKAKLSMQLLFGLLISILIGSVAESSATTLFFPFFKNVGVDLGLFYFVFSSIVITGSSNAVNLTDGLDGLAIMPIIIAAACFALISYLTGNIVFANYLQLNYVQSAGEIAILCASLIGAGLGFLWYNAPPAKVFMGDIGSLSLGALLGSISVITKHEIVLGIICGLFVIEAMSVILQVASFKLYGRRIFKMAPIHHHFEKLGWSESTIVMRFWIVAIIFALIALSTLKLR